MPTKKKRMDNFFINAFYHSKFEGQIFVIKASGDIIENDKALSSLIGNIKSLTLHGIKVLLVYGGGKAVDAELENRNIPISKKDGRRITNAATLEVMKDVIGGRLSLKLAGEIARHNVEGLSLNAVPAGWMRSDLRAKKPVDFGFVGDIISTDKRAIMRPFKTTNFIACPCLAFTKKGELLNINADTIATELAIGIEAGKLIFMSNVDGVLIEDKTAFAITAEDIPALIKNGTVTGGMQIKMENCLRALNNNVRRIHLINGLHKDALYKEIFESVGPGTMLLTAAEQNVYNNEIEIQKALGSKS